MHTGTCVRSPRWNGVRSFICRARPIITTSTSSAPCLTPPSRASSPFLLLLRRSSDASHSSCPLPSPFSDALFRPLALARHLPPRVSRSFGFGFARRPPRGLPCRAGSVPSPSNAHSSSVSNSASLELELGFELRRPPPPLSSPPPRHASCDRREVRRLPSASSSHCADLRASPPPSATPRVALEPTPRMRHRRRVPRSHRVPPPVRDVHDLPGLLHAVQRPVAPRPILERVRGYIFLNHLHRARRPGRCPSASSLAFSAPRSAETSPAFPSRDQRVPRARRQRVDVHGSPTSAAR